MRRSLWVLCLVACGGAEPSAVPRSSAAPDGRDAAESAGSVVESRAPAECAGSPRWVDVAPETTAAHRNLDTWLGKLPAGEADRRLLPSEGVHAFNAQAASLEGAWRDPLGSEVVDPARVAEQLDERIDWMRDRVETGAYVTDVEADWNAALAIVARATPVDRVHAVAAETPLWCAPLRSGLYAPPRDHAFDRNRCGSAHPGEWARVLRETEHDGRRWSLVHVGHGVGWVDRARNLGKPIALDEAIRIRGTQTSVVVRDRVRTEGGQTLRLGTRVALAVGDPEETPDAAPDGDPQAERTRVLVPGPDGFRADTVESSAVASPGQPLTRRLAFSLALSELDRPYGWGGRAGERDCSRLLRDVFVPFGLELARHSAVQAKQGTETLEVGTLEEAAKRGVIREAAERGLVLLYMPGHIMLYLGEDAGAGPQRMYAVSAISEFLTPCPAPASEGAPEPQDLVHRLDRVAVTTLELGRGTSRTSFIERITRVVVLGAAAPEPAEGAGGPEAGS